MTIQLSFSRVRNLHFKKLATIRQLCLYLWLNVLNVDCLVLKVTVQFERCFRLMEHIFAISCRNPINLYITEKLIKFPKSLFNFYLLISNK